MKVLNLKIAKCNKCPYCQHNGDYGRGYDSGYDCQHFNGGDEYGYRIVDDKECNNPNTKKRWKKDPFKIPEWCPLSNEGEEQ